MEEEEEAGKAEDGTQQGVAGDNSCENIISIIIDIVINVITNVIFDVVINVIIIVTFVVVIRVTSARVMVALTIIVIKRSIILILIE